MTVTIARILVVLTMGTALGTGSTITASGGREPQVEATKLATPDERYYRLWKEIKEARKREEEERAVRAAEADTRETAPRVPLLAPFVPRYQAAAADYAGTEDAVPFLVWLVIYGGSVDNEATPAAMATIAGSHVQSEGLEALGSSLPWLQSWFGPERAREMLAKFESRSPLVSIRAWAAFARLDSVLYEADIDSPEYIAVRSELLQIVEASHDESLEDRFGRVTRERELFALGMVAPEIVGADLDGVPLRLSDYRGRILLVNFWGDWSYTCRDLYSHQRSLVEAMDERPFASIGVNWDELEDAKEAIAANGLNWRSFRDDLNAPSSISDYWCVDAWPTFVVLDDELRIRYRGQDDKEATRVAVQLVGALEEARRER